MNLERETLHVTGGEQHIALVETRAQGDDGSPPQLVRYQLVNHLGSVSLELDDAGDIISYEEYCPYGSTSYQAVDQCINASAKRYRYSSKERDEETGFGYHGARYYLSGLGRWVSIDPLFIESPQASPYMGLGDNPIMFVDRDGNQITALERTIDRNTREFMTGQISEQELKDRSIAQAGGTGIGGTVGLVIVGGVWLAPQAYSGFLVLMAHNPAAVSLGPAIVGGGLEIATGAELAPGVDDLFVAPAKVLRAVRSADPIVELGAEVVEGSVENFPNSAVKSLDSGPYISPSNATTAIHAAASADAKPTVALTNRAAIRKYLGATTSLADDPAVRDLWIESFNAAAIYGNTRAGANWRPKNELQKYLDKLSKSGGNFSGITNNDIEGAWGTVTGYFRKRYIAKFGQSAWDAFDDIHHEKLKSLFPEEAFNPANLYPVAKADHDLWHNVYSEGAGKFGVMAPQFR